MSRIEPIWPDESPVEVLRQCESQRRQLLAETRQLIYDSVNLRDEAETPADVRWWSAFIVACERLAEYYDGCWFRLNARGDVKRTEPFAFPGPYHFGETQ